MRRRAKRRKKIFASVLIIIALLFSVAVLMFVFQDRSLSVSHYDISSEKLPQSFEGYKIAHISDLHNNEISSGQQELIDEVKNFGPDIIVMTGDMVNRDYFDFELMEHLTEELMLIAPVYSVDGNHEMDNLEDRERLHRLYLEKGVIITDGTSVKVSSPIEGSGEEIMIYGQYMYFNEQGHFWLITDLRPSDTEQFNVILSHFSNLFDELSLMEFDLVFAGHTHGGIIRLPIIGGLISYDTLFFPAYDGGVFVENDTTMVSSRGLGEADVDLRFNNPPELVTVTLHSTK